MPLNRPHRTPASSQPPFSLPGPAASIRGAPHPRSYPCFPHHEVSSLCEMQPLLIPVRLGFLASPHTAMSRWVPTDIPLLWQHPREAGTAGCGPRLPSQGLGCVRPGISSERFRGTTAWPPGPSPHHPVVGRYPPPAAPLPRTLGNSRSLYSSVALQAQDQVCCPQCSLLSFLISWK